MATTEANSSSSIPKSTKQSQVPAGFPTSPNGDIKMMFPIMCPAFCAGGFHKACIGVAPPQPQPPVRAENALGAARPDGENAAQAEGQPGDENQGENENRPVENDNQVEPAEQNGFNWRVIVKEIQKFRNTLGGP
ncbi:hypothetical protein IFM89_015282 [Coptis chinensis]|uniref:Uncharacterized protein n=1 Tax=Coptis chinensis TaxID=261450 RepID=A0A835HBZ2_9MAGN|nr:hypothetical protein IFM89_015282 [Coptis chinensis]